MQLTEATLHDICSELGNRNLSFVFIAQYFNGPPHETLPFFSFGVRREDICHMLGLTDIAKQQLRHEFSEITNIVPEEDDDENSELI